MDKHNYFLLLGCPNGGGFLILDVDSGEVRGLDERSTTGVYVGADYVLRVVQRHDCFQLWNIKLDGNANIAFFTDISNAHDILEFIARAKKTATL